MNLPASAKMTEPRYQEFAPDRIPVVQPAPGVAVKVIAGTVDAADGVAVPGPIVGEKGVRFIYPLTWAGPWA